LNLEGNIFVFVFFSLGSLDIAFFMWAIIVDHHLKERKRRKEEREQGKVKLKVQGSLKMERTV